MEPISAQAFFNLHQFNPQNKKGHQAVTLLKSKTQHIR